MSDPLLVSIGKAHCKSPAQLMLRWRGGPDPATVTPERYALTIPEA